MAARKRAARRAIKLPTVVLLLLTAYGKWFSKFAERLAFPFGLPKDAA